MSKYYLLIMLLSSSFSLSAADWDNLPVPTQAGEGKIWQLLPLSDDFNYDAPADGKSSEFQQRWKEGFINSWTGPSLTEWHPSQSYVSNGTLKLTAKRKPGTWDIYLGSLTSKQTVQYPLFMEVRAKLSNSVLASDFWLLSADSTQEIDVLEAYGGDRIGNEWYAERLHLSHHVFIREPFQDYQPKSDDTWYHNSNNGNKPWRDDFHRIGVFWRDPWHLRYYVDGKLVKTSSGKDVIDPLNFTKGTGLSKPMHAIINMEDQDWRTKQGLTPTDEELADREKMTYQIDWVRFYKPVAATTATRPTFDMKNDTLLAQFDIKGDLDDIHAIAALGSMLASDEYKDLAQRTYAVQGTVERTSGTQYYVPELMNQAFGAENNKWFDALGDYDAALHNITRRVVAGLNNNNNGGKVWVMEAGQSAFTHDWLQKIINDDNGISAEDTRNRVIVVQHSWYNEEQSNQQKLGYLMKHARYIAIDDGNAIYGQEQDRGPNTARLQGRQDEKAFTSGDPKWLNAAGSEKNQKTAAKKLWTMADDFIKAMPSIHGKLHQQGGTDYSDMVEVLWILGLNDEIDTNNKFWQRFVTTVAVQPNPTHPSKKSDL
jgi:hypothetical protein